MVNNTNDTKKEKRGDKNPGQHKESVLKQIADIGEVMCDSKDAGYEFGRSNDKGS